MYTAQTLTALNQASARRRLDSHHSNEWAERALAFTFHHTQLLLDSVEIPSVNTEWNLQRKTLGSQPFRPV